MLNVGTLASSNAPLTWTTLAGLPASFNPAGCPHVGHCVWIAGHSVSMRGHCVCTNGQIVGSMFSWQTVGTGMHMVSPPGHCVSLTGHSVGTGPPGWHCV